MFANAFTTNSMQNIRFRKSSEGEREHAHAWTLEISIHKNCQTLNKSRSTMSPVLYVQPAASHTKNGRPTKHICVDERVERIPLREKQRVTELPLCSSLSSLFHRHKQQLHEKHKKQLARRRRLHKQGASRLVPTIIYTRDPLSSIRTRRSYRGCCTFTFSSAYGRVDDNTCMHTQRGLCSTKYLRYASFLEFNCFQRKQRESASAKHQTATVRDVHTSVSLKKKHLAFAPFR